MASSGATLSGHPRRLIPQMGSGGGPFEPASTENFSSHRLRYCTLLTLLRLLTALIDFVAFVTRVAAGLRALLPLDCGAFGVTFFVGMWVHLPPQHSLRGILNRSARGFGD